jgi:hypothetical protein
VRSSDCYRWMHAAQVQTAAVGVLNVGFHGLGRLHSALLRVGSRCGGLCKCVVLGGLCGQQGS